MNGQQHFHPNQFYVNNELLATAYDLAEIFWSLGNSFRNARLIDVIAYLQNILHGVIPVPYQTKCMCPAHIEMYSRLPAKFYLSLCNKTRQEAQQCNVNIDTIIIEDVLVVVRPELPNTPLQVQMWCSLTRFHMYDFQRQAFV